MISKDEITHQTNRLFPVLHYLYDNGEFDNVINDIKSKLEMENKNVTGWDELVKAVTQSLINAGIGIAEDEIEKILHKDKHIIAPIANDVHVCPQGTHWSDSLNRCVDDIG